ncbi:MAG: LysR family transcriptional regulator [Acidobacteriaceae bacterium]|nr:LysR family transcriptional regulator [Acidobacteriaceae bacterium]
MQNRDPIEVEIFIFMIAQEGNFNRAAKKLGITLPSLTRRGASLERDIGVKLFARSTRSVVLTAAFAQTTDVTVYEFAFRKNDRNWP